MNDLVDVLDLRTLLESEGIDIETSSNFEAVFADLYEADASNPLLRAIEDRIYDYFSQLELPHEATIYDRLVLALQPRDLVATFNWDPLLYLAYRRNLHLKRLPTLVALHGSVAVGACITHQSFGFASGSCGTCRKPYSRVKLLYPIRRKNYQADSFIAGQWEYLRAALKQGYLITFFGYGAPETDVEAVSLLREMAEANSVREWGDVEIIDIKSLQELHDRWQSFFVRGHYAIMPSFADSILTQNPRRSAETLWLRTMEVTAVAAQPYPETLDLRELQRAAKDLMASEPTKLGTG